MPDPDAAPDLRPRQSDVTPAELRELAARADERAAALDALDERLMRAVAAEMTIRSTHPNTKHSASWRSASNSSATLTTPTARSTMAPPNLGGATSRSIAESDDARPTRRELDQD